MDESAKESPWRTRRLAKEKNVKQKKVKKDDLEYRRSFFEEDAYREEVLYRRLESQAETVEVNKYGEIIIH